MDCKECRAEIPESEVLQFGHNLFFGDWAMVLGSDGTVEKVKLSKVKEVRTLHSVYDIEMNNVARNMTKALTKISL